MNTANTLNNLARKTRRLTLCWIKAHVGHVGNEQADDLAKMATTMKFLTSIPRSTSINKSYTNNVAQEMWKKEWENEVTCRQTKQFIPYPDQRRSKSLITLARSQLSVVLKLITGHNALAYHASKIDPEIDDTCSLCQEEKETFHHFITECPRLRMARINSCLLYTSPSPRD